MPGKTYLICHPRHALWASGGAYVFRVAHLSCRGLSHGAWDCGLLGVGNRVKTGVCLGFGP